MLDEVLETCVNSLKKNVGFADRSWYVFSLRRIGAHGILADDMGLGKTLQALMAVAMCHHSRAHQRGDVTSALCWRWCKCSVRFVGVGV